MPCRSDGYDEPTLSNSNQGIKELEALLCSACRALENFSFSFPLNPALDKWWDKHKKEDEARMIREIKEALEKKSAIELAEKKTISQLTKDEKSLLKKYNLL